MTDQEIKNILDNVESNKLQSIYKDIAFSMGSRIKTKDRTTSIIAVCMKNNLVNTNSIYLFKAVIRLYNYTSSYLYLGYNPTKEENIFYDSYYSNLGFVRDVAKYLEDHITEYKALIPIQLYKYLTKSTLKKTLLITNYSKLNLKLLQKSLENKSIKPISSDLLRILNSNRFTLEERNKVVNTLLPYTKILSQKLLYEMNLSYTNFMPVYKNTSILILKASILTNLASIHSICIPTSIMQAIPSLEYIVCNKAILPKSLRSRRIAIDYLVAARKIVQIAYPTNIVLLREIETLTNNIAELSTEATSQLTRWKNNGEWK